MHRRTLLSVGLARRSPAVCRSLHQALSMRKLLLFLLQIFVYHRPAMGSRQFCRGRGRGRELEAEARQTKFEARPRRGDPLKKNPPSPRCIAVPNLVALSQTVLQRVNDLVAPPSWVEVIYVIPLYGVSRGLNLILSSVGGRSLKLTDYYRAEPRPRQIL